MGSVSFGAAVYLLLKGDLPDEPTSSLMDAILVSSVDHGATPPSVLSARTIASTGASLSAAVGGGILAINQHHGGAIENCALALQAIVRSADSNGDIDAAASAHLNDLKASGKRIAGFGHRIHTNDPRTARLFELADRAGRSGKFIDAARAVEQVFADRGKALPINVDGAIAAVLCELEFDPTLMNGIFIIARTAGLIAHVHEEQQRMKPMRRIDPVNQIYDGPEPRPVPKRSPGS